MGNESCTLCGREGSDLNHEAVEELIVEQYFELPAVTSDGTSTGRNWQLRHHRTVHTYVCQQCAEREKARAKRRGPRNIAICGALTVLLLALIMYLFSHNANQQYDLVLIGLVFPGGFVAFIANMACIGQALYLRRMKNVFSQLHMTARKKVGVCDEPVPIEFDPPVTVGASFYVTPEGWQEIAEKDGKGTWQKRQT